MWRAEIHAVKNGVDLAIVQIRRGPHANLWPLGAVPLIPTRPARNSAAATAFTTR